MKSLALALAIGTALAAAACSTSDPESFLGTELKPKRVAEDFRLDNQFGRPVALSDRKGDVVVLTFLYSTCPDVCPVVAVQLRDALEALADDADRVSLVAVSVDPEGDSEASAREFAEKWGLADSLDFLLGDGAELAPVWDAYHLAPSVRERDSSHSGAILKSGSAEITDRELEELRRRLGLGEGAARGGVDVLRQESARYLVIHSAPIYLIDRDGFARSVFTLPFATEDLVNDVRLLLE